MTQGFSFVGSEFRSNFKAERGQNERSEPSGAVSGHPSRRKKRPKWPPRGSQKGSSEEDRDDPEAEGLKREGAKSSKMGNIQKWALNEYGKQIFKE